MTTTKYRSGSAGTSSSASLVTSLCICTHRAHHQREGARSADDEAKIATRANTQHKQAHPRGVERRKEVRQRILQPDESALHTRKHAPQHREEHDSSRASHTTSIKRGLPRGERAPGRAGGAGPRRLSRSRTKSGTQGAPTNTAFNNEVTPTHGRGTGEYSTGTDHAAVKEEVHARFERFFGFLLVAASLGRLCTHEATGRCLGTESNSLS